MAKIIGNTTATPNPRPDWNQTDPTKADYIKNKPDINSETITSLQMDLSTLESTVQINNDIANAAYDNANINAENIASLQTIIDEVASDVGFATDVAKTLPDWNQTDVYAYDYIKNKPEIMTEEDIREIIAETGGGDTSLSYANNTFANALKGTASGTNIVLNDVSPVEHDVSVVVPNNIDLTFDTFEDSGAGYLSAYLDVDNVNKIEHDKTYKVFFNEKEYICTSNFRLGGAVCIGNVSPITSTDYSEPFALFYISPDAVGGPFNNAGYMFWIFPDMLESVSDSYNIRCFEADTTVTINGIEYTPNADGIIEGVKSSPSMTLVSNGGNIKCTYNRDINKKLVGKLISDSGEIFNDYREVTKNENGLLTTGNEASSEYAHTEGSLNRVNQKYGHAEGTGNIVSIEPIVEIREPSEKDTNDSMSSDQLQSIEESHGSGHAEGYQTRVYSCSSHAEGHQTAVYSPMSHAEGANNVVFGGMGSHIEGHSLNKADSQIFNRLDWDLKNKENLSREEVVEVWKNGVAEQNIKPRTFAAAFGNYCHVEGSNNLAAGNASHAEGSGSLTLRQFSHAEGNNTEALGEASHSEGYGTSASGHYSHTEGRNTSSLGESSHAEGRGTSAAAEAAHAEGSGTKAEGITSHAEGQGTVASGSQSHAEGLNSKATGLYSHAEGYNTKASGSTTHAEGFETEANGRFSHSGGRLAIANGDCSFVHGYNVKASSVKTTGESGFVPQFATGRFNAANNSALFMIGNGTADNARSNAFEVLSDGSATIQKTGDLGNSIVTKDYVNGLVGDIETALDSIIAIQEGLIGGET